MQPFDRSVELELRGNLRKKVSVRFEFSCHCYSRGPAAGDIISPEWRVPDGSVHKPRDRIFDRTRYDLSKGLVGLIDALILNNGVVAKTRQENFFRTEVIQRDADGALVASAYATPPDIIEKARRSLSVHN